MEGESCWEQGRQCRSMSNILCDEEPAYESKQDTHNEREREVGTKEYVIFQEATVTNDNQQ